MAWELAISIGILGAAAILVYLSTTLDESHVPIKFLFLFGGLFILLIATSTNSQILEANNSTITAATLTRLEGSSDRAYTTLMWIIYFTLFYFIIFYFAKVLMKIKDYAQMHSKDKRRKLFNK